MIGVSLIIAIFFVLVSKSLLQSALQQRLHIHIVVLAGFVFNVDPNRLAGSGEIHPPVNVAAAEQMLSARTVLIENDGDGRMTAKGADIALDLDAEDFAPNIVTFFQKPVGGFLLVQTPN